MANDYSASTPPPAKGGTTRQPSAHRGVIYAAGLPGCGEFHAGAWLQGALTMAAFFGFLGWFSWLSWRGMLLLADWAAGGAVPVWDGRALGLAFLGMLVAWFWGIFNAARTAQEERIRRGLPPQCAPAWAAVVSWLAPGSGQAYAGKPLFGLGLLLLYCCGLALMAPAYAELGSGIVDLVSSQSAAMLQQPILLAGAVRELFFMLDNSLPAVFIEATRMLAIAEAVQVVAWQRERQEVFVFEIPEARRPWYSSTEARAAGLFVLGWFAPGAGQLYLGRSYGWYFLATVVGCHLAVALMLRHGVLGVETAGLLLWLPTLATLAAMLEAPVRVLQSGSVGGSRPREEAV